MKKILMIAAMALTSIAAMAQTDEERAQMARDVLDRMAAKNKSYSTITVDFTLSIDNHQNQKKENQKGSIVVKGDKYVLDIFGMTSYYDGKVAAAWMHEAAEVNITEPEEDEETALSPAKMFGAYEKGYRLRYMGEQKLGAAQCSEVELYPTEKGVNIVRIRLLIDKQTDNIKQMLQQGKDGVVYTVTIDKFVVNKPVADAAFMFDAKAHPGVEVIDMR